MSAEVRTDRAQREIACSPETIYAAFIDPTALMTWLPPEGMSGTAIRYEPHEGGRYRIELRYGDASPEGSGKTSDRTDVTKGRFLEMVPGRRIKQTVEFESTDPAFAGEMLLTWSFAVAPRGTLVSVTAERVPRGISKEDHDTGLRSSLDNLARFVEPRQ